MVSESQKIQRRALIRRATVVYGMKKLYIIINELPHKNLSKIGEMKEALSPRIQAENMEVKQ